MLDSICELIKENIKLFRSFEHIFIFGSVLSLDKEPNDIDILLLYSEYTGEILSDLKFLINNFKDLSDKHFDFTVLSIEEEREVGFIGRLGSNYFKVR